MATPVLSDQLERLLAHPGWQIVAKPPFTSAHLETLHDLRKTVKTTRYQAEFFAPIHSTAFCHWLTELKLLQDTLGALQDNAVLSDWLTRFVNHPETLSQLRQQFDQNQQAAWQDWQPLRAFYTSTNRQRQLRDMIALPPPHPVQIPLTPEQQVLVNLNHELRTPLQTVLVRLEQVLRSPQLTSEDYQSLQHANAATQHMVHVVREFLQFSSETIKPAHPESASEVVELAVLLNTLVQIYTLHAKDHGLSCHFVASATLPSHIQVSERLLRQVLTALLENAIRYTHTGGITLRVRSQLPLHDGINTPQTGLLRFEVEDTGIGLTPADRARVFEPFCQLATSPEKRSGLGLGLTLSRHAVMQMGGELQVASFPGQGSIFWFEIPVQIVLPRPVVLDAREQELDPHLLLPQPEYLTPLYRAACRGDVTQVTAQAQALAQRDSRYDEFVTQVLWLIAQQPAAAGAIAQWLEPYVALR